MKRYDKKHNVVEKNETLYEFLQHYRLMDDILAARPEIKVPPIVAVTLEGPFEKWTPPRMQAWHRVRRLDGSTVAAALAAFTGKVPCAMFAAQRPQVIQAAIAAMGLGGQLYAIPLCGTEALAGPVIRAADFIKGHNAVVCCTSVSEVCVLDRVRFRFDQTVQTESITVSLATGKVTKQFDILDLNKANMRDKDGTEVKAMDLVHDFKHKFFPGTPAMPTASTISSRTPEGVPNHCPICDTSICIEPSHPPGDAPCPSCGMLLWFFNTSEGMRFYESKAVAPIRDRIIQRICEMLGVTEGLDVIELVMELEEEFDLSIPHDEAENIKTVGDAIDYLAKRKLG